MKIPSSKKCEHCGHWAGDDDRPFRIVSERRFIWMMEAVECYHYMQGDDAWLDWEELHKELLESGE